MLSGRWKTGSDIDVVTSGGATSCFTHDVDGDNVMTGVSLMTLMFTMSQAVSLMTLMLTMSQAVSLMTSMLTMS